MAKKIVISFSIIAGFALAVGVVLAWTEPAQAPPTCPSGQPGCDAPINVSGSSQTKAGDFTVSGAYFYARNMIDLDNTGYLVNPTGNSIFNTLRLAGLPNCQGNKTLDTSANGTLFCGDDDVGSGSLWSQNGSNIYYNSGNVGIGITNPSGALHIRKGNGAEARLIIENTGPQGGEWNIFSTDNNGQGSHKLIFANPIPRVTFIGDTGGVDTGNVGIGTVDPISLLHLYKSGGDAELRLQSSTGGTWRITSQSGINRFDIIDAAASIRLTINSVGNVGIGDTTPDQKLDVAGYVKGQTGLCIGADCRTSWPGGGLQGGGTVNYVSKFTGSGTLGNSQIFDNGSNVGIGTAAPDKKLTLDSSTNIDGIKIRAPQPSITLFEEVSSNQWQWYVQDSNGDLILRDTGNTAAMTVQQDSDVIINSGNVGIGTTGPGSSLTVVGDIEMRETDNGNTAAFLDATGTYGELSLYRGGVAVTKIAAASGGNSYFNNGGNVGIGTPSPTAKLHVNGSQAKILLNETGANDPVVDFKIGGVNKWIAGVDNSDGDQFKIDDGAGLGGTSQFMLSTSRAYFNGNVGIGTTGPGAKLEVYTTGTTALRIAGGSLSGFPLLQLQDDETGGVQWNIENGREGDGILGFYHASGVGTAMVLDNAGNVGIGTASPGQKLDVAGYVKGQTGLCIGADCRTSWPQVSCGQSFSICTTVAGKQANYSCASGILTAVNIVNNPSCGGIGP